MLVKRKRRWYEFKIFLLDPRDVKILLRPSARCLKIIENVLCELEVGVCLYRECVEIL